MKKLLLLCAVCLLLVFPVVASATSITADYCGTRSTADGGVNGNGSWSGLGNNGFEISWDISYDSTSKEFTYWYKLSGVGDTLLAQDISHWILEVTKPSNQNDFTDVISVITEGPSEWTNTQHSNLPGDIYGIKWEVVGNQSTYIVSFTTENDPVWGDFYVKDGNNVATAAWNVGFGTNPEDIDSPNFMHWIARPNGGDDWPHHNIPEPATMLLLGSGLIGIAVSGKKRFKKTNK